MTLRRFSIGALPFIRRPVSEPPPDGTICFADNGNANGYSWNSAALFKDGEWTNGRGKPLKHEPTYWTTLDVD